MSDTAANSNQEWNDGIAGFAKAIKLEPEAIATALKDLIGEPGAGAIALLQSEEDVPLAELESKFSAVPKAILRKAVREHLRAKAPATAPADSASSQPNASFANLPSVMDDVSWLLALKTGGDLRVDQPTIISSVKAAIANRVGLFEVPARLAEQMEKHAESIDEPVGAEYWRLRKTLTRQSYAEIFSAIEGVDGTYMTQARKNALLGRLDSQLWPALLGFHTQLRSWVETWQQGSFNPNALMMLVLNRQSGAALPPGMMQPPSTDAVRDAAEAVVAQINHVFGGTGIVVARGLAYDALKAKEALSEPTLPTLLGFANREQMLKGLGIGVTADYVRMERNLVQYVLSILEIANVPGGDAELAYLASLQNLGNQIPWNNLEAPASPSTTFKRAKYA